MSSLQFALFICCAFAIFKTGDSLRCWKCSSEMDAPCADYFNTTRYSRYSSPYPNYSGNNNQVVLEDCNDSGSNFYPNQRGQRAVCMKKKQTTYGRTTYVRQCRFLQYDEKVGACPAETTSSATTIDFCEYCDYDGCNGAPAMSASQMLAAVLPAIGMLLLRK